MAENLERNGSKLYLTTQILSAMGIILIVVFMIQNVPYLLTEIFRSSTQTRTRITYAIGLTPYLFCTIAYILFLLKKKNAGLIFSFLAIYRIINLISAFFISKKIQSDQLFDIAFTVAALVLVILITARKTARVLRWILAACTIAYAGYNIMINLAYLNNLLQSLDKTKSSVWPAILGILNFFNLYMLIAVCFCLMVLLIEKTQVAAASK